MTGDHGADDQGLVWAGETHAVLARAAVRQVAYLPDAGLKHLIALCQEDSAMTDVVLATEEEGVGLLAGAWLGGERGVLLMQSSGVGNCINTLSMIRTCQFPLLLVVTMRGEWGETNPWQLPMGQTAAHHLELAGVIVRRVEAVSEVAGSVATAAQLAFESSRAAAVLISQRVIGAKTFEVGP